MTLCLTAAIARHALAAVASVGEATTIGTLDWTALAAAEFLLLLVALDAPGMFQLRNFRLAGVAVAANAIVILFPLPEVLGIYDPYVPETMVFALAGGVAAMAVTFAVMSHPTVRQSDRVDPPETRNERLLPWALVLAALVVLPVWLSAIGVPPLLSLLGSGSVDLAVERQAALSRLEQPGIRFVVGMLRNLLLMFAAGWFVAAAAATSRQQWRARSAAELTAFAVAALGVLYALLTTERALAGELLVVCAIAVLVVRGRELSVKLLSTLVSAALVFPIAVGVLGGAGSTFEVLSGLRRRALYLPAEVMTRYFIEFPQFHDYLWGAAVPKLSYLTGGDPFDLSQHIYLRYYQRNQAVVGNANGSLFGVGWANFGVAGVIVWAVLLAAALVLLDRTIDRLPVRSSAALRGLGVVLAVLTTSADLFRTVLGFAPGFLDLMVLVALLTWFERRRTRRSGKLRGELASPRPTDSERDPPSVLAIR